MNECPHPRCDTEIPDGWLACKAHWFELPRALRNRIRRQETR